ncbi:ABC transporter substrate-binding protein [Aquabacter cavernae]|uniref:ABC transporter substrate-binding protein n=1 Tax=Aquabacter cavernae TaxID=2496029 RepID=UPI003B8455DE
MKAGALALGAALLATPAAAQVSDDVVRIGVLNDQAGPLSGYSGPGSVIAARMAVEDFGGTVLGKPVEVIVADHRNLPDVAVNTAREWFDVKGVDVISDLTSSTIALAVQGIGREKGKVVMHVGGGTDRLYGADCSPTGFLWVYDTYSFARGLGLALTGGPSGTWFYIASDTAFAKAMEAQLTPVIDAAGGKVLGAVKHPVGTSDFSSFLLQAQASGAKNIALLNTGDDTANAIKQATEFGLAQSGQSLVGTVIYLQTIHALGLQAAQGLKFVTTFYWDRTDGSRAFAKRFAERNGGRMPSQVQAGMYSSTLAYLRAVKAAGTDEGKAVAAKIRELPVDDFFAEGARVRADGRLMNDMFLATVKTPAQSKGPWDYYTLTTRLKADEIIRPLAAGGCPYLQQ